MVTTDHAPARKRVRKATVAAPNLSLKKAYQAGELIDEKYVLSEKLGEGGMGAVWRAHNETLDIDVAVKLIRAEETEADGGDRLGDRLLQEARAAARLGHPAIARVFDFGMSDRGDPFIVMELLKGEDLAEALARRGRINATKAVATLMPIAHALAAAHAKGIVHRDLKPENIYLARSEDGHVQPKLVDFGIAKIERSKSHRLTQTGTMLGSPIYMSPEQARGDDVDHLADIWAFCVVLYEMVTGRPPFEGKNYNALLYSIIADEPPPITSFAAGDDELWALLKRGFEKDPDRRWPTVRDLGMALASWMALRNVHEDITGASMSAQWLRRSLDGDVLASMMPTPEVNRLLPSASRADTLVIRGRLLRSRFPVVLTRPRLVAVAVASTCLGILGVVLLSGGQDAPSPEPERLVALEAVAPPREEEPAPEPPKKPESSPIPTEPAVSAVSSAAAPGRSKTPRKSKKRWVVKKPHLKNPFQSSP